MMKRNTKLAVAVVWVLAVAVAVFLGTHDRVLRVGAHGFSSIDLMYPLILPFTLSLSYLYLNREEGRDVRYARASRRLGTTALWVLAIGLLTYWGAGAFLTENLALDLLMIWALFLIAVPVGLAPAAVIYRIIQRRSAEKGGVALALFAAAPFLLIFGAMILFNPYERILRSGCASGLSQLGLVCKTFAHDNGWEYPQLSSRPGFLSMMNDSPAYEKPIKAYFPNTGILFCPGVGCFAQEDDAQRLMDNSSYIYFGYAIRNEQEMEAFYQCYRDRVAAGLPFDRPLLTDQGKGSGGKDYLKLLDVGLESFYEPDPAGVSKSTFPLFIERSVHHKPSGINVLYMDGHVEFLRYPGKWPATPRTFEIVAAIEALREKPAK